MDYGLPRADDLPNFDCELEVVSRTENNPLGAKGCGESGTVGGLACIMNALQDALQSVGVTQCPQMPVTPERVWRALATASL